MARKRIKDTPATSHFDFIYGTYHLSGWRVPYFSTTMPLSQAGESLRLASELPGSESINWRLSELFQRDIDWPRVERKIVPYLRDQDNPQFFNSLTIALLPYDSEHSRILEEFSTTHEWTPPKLDGEDRFEKTVRVGPISLGYWNEWSAITDDEACTGQIRWNPHEVFAVALDGQHRLAAIKALRGNGVSLKALERTRVPVILMFFDERLGYETPAPRPNVEVLRGIFIDLNKHARTVSRARQILLDDRDPHAVCVRAIVGERLCDSLDELALPPPRLPLSLVDWHSEQAKFDEGPYLTTVLGLDWIVSRLLDTKTIKDYTDYNGVRKQLNRLTKGLGVNLTDADKRLEEYEAVKFSPFSYTDDELQEIANAFARVWSWPVAHILTKFKPYDELLALRRAKKTFDLDFISWYPLYERKQQDKYDTRATTEYNQFLNRLRSRSDKPIGVQTLEKSYAALAAAKSNLAFNVVFQRALYEAFLEFAKIKESSIDELSALDEDDYVPDFDDDDEDEVETNDEPSVSVPTDTIAHLAEKRRERAGQFVTAMNRIVEAMPDFLQVSFLFDLEEDVDVDTRFWLGTLNKPEGGIDFTQGASRRAADLLFLCAAMCLYDDLTEPDEESDFDDFWVAVTQLDEDTPALCKRINRAVKRFAGKEAAAGGRILKAKGDDFDEDKSFQELCYRLFHVWTTVEL